MLHDYNYMCIPFLQLAGCMAHTSTATGENGLVKFPYPFWAVSYRWTGLLEWTTGMDYWNGL